jgi:ferredoxin
VNGFLIYILGLIPVYFMFRTSSAVIETLILPLAWLVFYPKGPSENPDIYYLPLVTTLLVLAGAGTRSQKAFWAMLPVVSVWLAGSLDTLFMRFSLIHLLAVGASSATLLIYIRDVFGKPAPAPKKIDVLLCSYSCNTAHFTDLFIEGAKKAGSEITLHRFHHYRDFHAQFDGDTLVVAFPVFGWKPPWPLCDYLLRKLPKGNGKPAFILYSSAGGPENAGVVAWFLLTMRGYRVIGRNWSTYPISVPTFRLGPLRLWRFIDRIYPDKKELKDALLTGEEFARGIKTGLPLIVWPFPLFIAGFLLDNRWVNTVMYRNYAWRRRCIGCGKCVEYCPSERLSIVNGFPKAKGTCALCLGCINICPKNAMHLVCWTEYGNQYKPRWPEFLVINKKAHQTLDKTRS